MKNYIEFQRKITKDIRRDGSLASYRISIPTEIANKMEWDSETRVSWRIYDHNSIICLVDEDCVIENGNVPSTENHSKDHYFTKNNPQFKTFESNIKKANDYSYKVIIPSKLMELFPELKEGQLVCEIKEKTPFNVECNTFFKIDDNKLGTITEVERNSPEYIKWRQRILDRDKQCMLCHAEDTLEVHHLFSYKEYPNLRVDDENGVVVCNRCHNLFHSIYGKETSPLDFYKYLLKQSNIYKTK